jgi:Cu-processing system permease protein
MPMLLLMLVAGVTLTAVFGALATLIAGLVEDRLLALGCALGTWALMTVAWDGLILWVTIAFADRPLEQPLLVLTFLNPVDLARVLLILRLDVSAMMGYTGAVFSNVLGGWTGIVASVAGLAAWALVPGLFALRAFKNRDF